MLNVINGVNGGIAGSNETNDVLTGGAEDNTFFVGRGVDSVDGGAGQDTLNVDGEAIEWNITRIDENTIVMTHPSWGENTLTNVESIFFARSGVTLTVDEAIAQTAGLPVQRVDSDNVLNGTNGDDVLEFTDGLQGLFGGVGDDTYIDNSDSFSQVNYDGERSEYNISQNEDGSITIVHPIWGTDTLIDIDALVFTGREPGVDGVATGEFEFLATDDIVFDAPLADPTQDDGDIITGTEDGDLLQGTSGDDEISGLNGNDNLFGREGNDSLNGGDGLDFLSGEAGEDYLFGGADDDRLAGGQGNDVLVGGGGSDQFIFEAGDGHDVITDFELGRDSLLIFRPDGNNFNSHEDSFSDIQDILIQDGDDTLIVYSSEDTIRLLDTRVDDLLAGPIVEDVTIIGTEGDDILEGGLGNDAIFGGAGNDVLDGGTGNDYLVGGEGADEFTFATGFLGRATDGDGHNVIADFEIGVDTISFRQPNDNAFDSTEDNFSEIEDMLTQDGDDVLITVNSDLSVRLLNTQISDLIPDFTTVIEGTAESDFLTGNFRDNQIFGLEGDDRIVGNEGNDLIDGGDGNDRLIGDAGDDTIFGGAGEDTIFGGFDNDIIDGGAGDDEILGGLGDDSITGGDGNDEINGGSGNNYLVGGSGADEFRFLGSGSHDTIADFEIGIDFISGRSFDGVASFDTSETGFAVLEDLLIQDGDDVLIAFNADQTIRLLNTQVADLLAGVGPDAILGTNGDDVLVGTAGDDEILGLDGVDNIRGGAGQDLIFGGDAGDTIAGGAGADIVEGGAGRDVITGGNSADIIDGGDDADQIFGGLGEDIISGGNGGDSLFGGASADVINGNDGVDIIYGGGAADTIDGGEGADEIYGGTGADDIDGGNGGDFINGGGGADMIDGGAGNDEIFGGGAGDFINGGDGADLIFGGAGADHIFGGNGADTLSGGSNDDVLNGSAGDDALNGGGGADTLFGGSGNDLLFGGAGEDLFVFQNETGFDRIVDFRSGEDVVDLNDFNFDGFEDLLLVQGENGNVFLFIDEDTSIEFTDITDIHDLSADDFVF